jgi:membrane protein
VAGFVFGRAAVQGEIQKQIGALIGGGAAGQVQTMVASAASNPTGGVLGIVFGAVVLVFGATGAFVALQDALNKTWHVKPDPNAGGIKAFLLKRVLSFGMILGVAFLLLVSLAVSAALAAFGGWASRFVPGAVSGALLQWIGAVVSFAVITILFAAIYKFLPDAKLAWRDVWIGSAATSLLFTLGKTAIGLYLGKSGATSAYGAAGSVMLIVLWLYYACLIFLLGAEFTKLWAAGHGRGLVPEPGAVRVETEERHIR